MRKKVLVLSVLLVIVLIGIIVSGYFIYFFMTKCSTKECFDNSLFNCKRTSFVSNTVDSAIEYQILGITGGKCKINVDILQLKKGSAELSVLEGKSMTCLVPLGVVAAPETNLQNCHGILKEEIQNIIIQRMQSQIVENLGQINAQTTNIL